MSLPETAYEAALAASAPALRAAALLSEKGRRAVRGRDEALRTFEAWAARERAPDRPLAWIHAPSVGEGLMAQAIVRALRDRRPDVQVAFTHFSPSAERIAPSIGADVWGYLPWDTRGPARRALRALRPSAIAFVRTEVWPVLSREAAGTGARLLLVNAVLSEGSGRLSWLARSFLEVAYRRLDAVGAVSDAHADRYRRLGVPPDRIRVTGDARFDQVWRRIEARGLAGLRGRPDAADRVPPELRALWRRLADPDRLTLVAGSTWPADEAVLLPAFAALRAEQPARLVMAPHEPTPAALDALERRLERAGIRHARLGAVEGAGRTGSPDGRAAPPGAGVGDGSAPGAGEGGDAPDAVVVDRLGVLADLYALADVAYVGGGFGTAGLHSVVEPAALGVPVLYGPAHGNAREAGELAVAGGGFVVEAGELESRLRALAADPAAMERAGARARAWVRGETGAAERNAALILESPGGTIDRVTGSGSP